MRNLGYHVTVYLLGGSSRGRNAVSVCARERGREGEKERK